MEGLQNIYIYNIACYWKNHQKDHFFGCSEFSCKILLKKIITIPFSHNPHVTTHMFKSRSADWRTPDGQVVDEDGLTDKGQPCCPLRLNQLGTVKLNVCPDWGTKRKITIDNCFTFRFYFNVIQEIPDMIYQEETNNRIKMIREICSGERDKYK